MKSNFQQKPGGGNREILLQPKMECSDAKTIV
jgi:hypothetical protein